LHTADWSLSESIYLKLVFPASIYFTSSYLSTAQMGQVSMEGKSPLRLWTTIFHMTLLIVFTRFCKDPGFNINPSILIDGNILDVSRRSVSRAVMNIILVSGSMIEQLLQLLYGIVFRFRGILLHLSAWLNYLLVAYLFHI
jgi:hypothetical protein